MSAEGFRTVRLAGVSMLVHGDQSAARTVVFLHGIAGRADGFRALMAAWPGPDRLIAWDAPGYGESEMLPDQTPSPSDYAVALRRALDAAGVGRLHLVGQSLGALFAASFAASHPERVLNLALMAPAPGYGTGKGALADALAQRITEFDTQGGPAFAAARASRLVNDPARKKDVVDLVRAAMASLSKEGHRPAVHALSQGNLGADCAILNGPVLLITGAEDMITPVAGTSALFDSLRKRPRRPGTREQMMVIGDAGHALFIEHPVAVAAAMHAFIGSAA